VKPSSADALIGFVQQAPTRKAQASMKRLSWSTKVAISIDEKAVFIDEKAVLIDEKAVLIDEKFDGRPFFHRWKWFSSMKKLMPSHFLAMASHFIGWKRGHRCEILNRG
jgi:hypothetical protein